MKKYWVKRLIQLPIILLGVIAVTFLIVQFTPGDPAVKLAGSSARVEDIEAIREQLGLNKPMWEQFVDYFVNILHGDFGISFVRKTEISGELMTALINTVYLMVFARIWSVLAAIPLGIIAALKQNTWLDKTCMALTLVGISIPQFWLGLMLMKFFCLELGLQTVNYRTLKRMNRGHGLAEFIDAVLQIRNYGFQICAHVILNYPGDELEDAVETARVLSALQVDTVKIHSLYIPKNTVLCEAYENGTISVCSKEEYMDRLIAFLSYLSPDIAVERLFGRIPREEAVFCNWGASWWKLRDEAEKRMRERDAWQGKYFHYLGGSALRK